MYIRMQSYMCSPLGIAGVDLTETLLKGVPSPRQCTFHWHDSMLQNGGSGLAAVRCGDLKAHFYTQGDYAIAGGRTKTWGKGGKQDPPLLFNLTADPTGAALYYGGMHVSQSQTKLTCAGCAQKPTASLRQRTSTRLPWRSSALLGMSI
jgi:hypothetical protein